MKVLALRRSDACTACSTPLAAGTKAAWDADGRRTYCLSCHESQHPQSDSRTLPPTVAVEVTAEQQGKGGVSAQREYDKRSAHRDQRIREQHPRLGGLLLALSNEPTSTRVWAQGAAGERAVAAKLDALVGQHVSALHDRRMRRPDGSLSKANIDHIAVTQSGVWVIDAKTHQGSLEVRRSGGLFSPRVEALYINGRDQTRLVHGLLKQVDAVRHELSAVEADVAVMGALCFVGTELPWFGSSSIAEVPLVGRRGLAKLLLRPGDVSAADRQAVATFLDQRFPAAA
jgi:hypothetical protein